MCFRRRIARSSPTLRLALTRPPPRQKDYPRMQSILQDHRLVAVTTFGRQANAATFLYFIADSGPSSTRARIDFILCREHQSDRCTRQAHALRRAPFAPITGNRHLALTVTMPWPRQRLLPRRRGGTPRWTATAIRKWRRPQTYCNASSTLLPADCNSTRFPAPQTPVPTSTRTYKRPGLT